MKYTTLELIIDLYQDKKLTSREALNYMSYYLHNRPKAYLRSLCCLEKTNKLTIVRKIANDTIHH